MATTSIDIDRPAEQVYAYVTDPSQFHEWQQGVVSGGIKEPGPPSVGSHCQMVRRIGGAERHSTSARPAHQLVRARHRRTDPGAGRRHRVTHPPGPKPGRHRRRPRGPRHRQDPRPPPGAPPSSQGDARKPRTPQEPPGDPTDAPELNLALVGPWPGTSRSSPAGPSESL